MHEKGAGKVGYNKKAAKRLKRRRDAFDALRDKNGRKRPGSNTK